MTTFDLTGRVALVTGSSRGIGNVLAGGLAQAGATVVLNGLDAERLEKARIDLAGTHGDDRVAAVAFDVTDPDAVAAGVAEVESRVGPVRILVNNAGVQHRVPLLELAADDWDRVVRTDLTSAFLVGREVARHMIDRGTGKIVNICSVQSELARPTIAAYTAAKGGLRNLTQTLALEYARDGIRINSVAPGAVLPRGACLPGPVPSPPSHTWPAGAIVFRALSPHRTLTSAPVNQTPRGEVGHSHRTYTNRQKS
jgi:gluconate 5-dehydrogenase